MFHRFRVVGRLEEALSIGSAKRLVDDCQLRRSQILIRRWKSKRVRKRMKIESHAKLMMLNEQNRHNIDWKEMEIPLRLIFYAVLDVPNKPTISACRQYVTSIKASYAFRNHRTKTKTTTWSEVLDPCISSGQLTEHTRRVVLSLSEYEAHKYLFTAKQIHLSSKSFPRIPDNHLCVLVPMVSCLLLMASLNN